MEEQDRAGEGVKEVGRVGEQLGHARPQQTDVLVCLLYAEPEDVLVQHDAVDGMVGQEGGPVVDAVEGQQAAYGHGLMGMGLGEGQRRGEAGAQIGTVDVDIAALEFTAAVGGRREGPDEKVVGSERVRDWCRPVERRRDGAGEAAVGGVGRRILVRDGARISIFGPAVVDCGAGELMEKGREVAIHIGDVLVWESRKVNYERGRDRMVLDIVKATRGLESVKLSGQFERAIWDDRPDVNMASRCAGYVDVFSIRCGESWSGGETSRPRPQDG